MARHIDRLPRGTSIVVRALPKSARASSDQLGDDVDQALTAVGL
jgi:hypothetical protein